MRNNIILLVMVLLFTVKVLLAQDNSIFEMKAKPAKTIDKSDSIAIHINTLVNSFKILKKETSTKNSDSLVIIQNYNHVLKEQLCNTIMDQLEKTEKNKDDNNEKNETETKDEKTESGFDIVSGLISNFKGYIAQPKVELKYKHSVREDYNLFVKLTGNPLSTDDSKSLSAMNFFIPEMQTLNFKSSALINLKNAPLKDYIETFSLRLGGDFGWNILKAESNDTLNKEDSDIFATRLQLGFECIVFENFSLFGNLNFMWIVAGVDDYKNYFELENNSDFIFADLGLRAALDKNGQYMIEIGMVLINGDIQPLISNSDLVIPSLRIGLTKTLSNDSDDQKTQTIN